MATGSQASAQQLGYGTRSEDGEQWAYIEVQGGQELIAAPLITPQNGYLDLGDGYGSVLTNGPALTLSGSFQPGSENKFRLEGANPKSSGVLVIGFELEYGELYGVPIVPGAAIQMPIKTDSAGGASLKFNLPSDWSLGTNIYVQALVKDKANPLGLTVSNVIRASDTIAGQLIEDSSRIRLLGFELDELEVDTEAIADCVSDEIQAYIDLLNSTVAMQCAFLWQEGPGDFGGTEDEWETISHLSQNFMFIAQKAVPFTSAGWTSNGCTASPDFDFGHCCDAHDHCYCIGGDCPCEGGLFDHRKDCDLDLRDCIRRAGHPNLAKVYYRAVRWFGKSHFNCW